METKDFRIGNWVLENGSYHQIEADDFYNPQLFKPIRLTKEILLKIGAKSIDDGTIKLCDKYIFDRFKLSFYPNKNGGFFKITDVCGAFFTNVEYIHEWQNFVFVMNQIELEINL